MATSVIASARQAEDGKTPHVIPRAASEVVVDGVIDEQAWSEALTLELKYEIQPGENTEPPVRTVAFVTYNDSHVLIAFRCYDPNPKEIRARFRDRDDIWADDNVGVVLDTFNDERRAYEFFVNPLGAQMEGVFNGVAEGERSFDRAWDAIWESAGRLTDFGYEVELAIGFNQIRFQGAEGPQIWGIDLVRSWPRSDYVRIGLFPRERGANSYLAQEDKVIGFEGVTPGRNLEFAPTLTGYTLEQRPDFPDSIEPEKDQSAEVGATVRWGVTPNITLLGAVNPDFSQIEADAIQLSINQRFALFYPEKRPFFLESKDYFSTGLRLLYTRMIEDPIVALKLTGKGGRHTVGVFSARDEVTNLIVPGPQGSDSGSFESSNTSTVGRYRYDLGSDSTIGMMLTDRRGEGGYFNRVASVDALFRPSEADSISINAAFSSSQYSTEMVEELELGGEEISDHAVRVEYVHTERNWFSFVEFQDYGDDFRADLGFIPQVGFRQGNAGGGYLWWGDEDTWYNRIELGGFIDRSEDQEGGLLGSGTQVWVEGQGPLQTNFHFRIGNRTVVYEDVRFDDLFTPFVTFRIRPASWIRFHVNGFFGDWVDFANIQPADRVRLSGGATFNLGRHLELELRHLYSTLDVEGGQLFEANAPQLTAVWQFNTRTFFRAILQYSDITRNQDLYEEDVDELSRDYFVQLLFSYKVNPQTVFFLGYSDGGQENQDIGMTATDRSLFLKIGYAWTW